MEPNNNKTFASFDIAVKLAREGFPQENATLFYKDEKTLVSNPNHLDTNFYGCVPLSDVQTWLREEKNIHIEQSRLFGKWGFRLLVLRDNGEFNPHIESKSIYDTYDECLKYAIEKALSYIETYDNLKD